jgi:hypothetical protein
MANNITKIDQIHNLMPAHYNTRTNPNWIALITALGTSDQNVADLVALLKQQFFIKTASGTYLDNLGANDGVSRPPGVGMVDSAFKKYIPILAYSPKQVRFILDQLLNIFFLPEETTAYTESTKASPYALQDGWSLEYTVDGTFDELITFNTSDFANIGAATATEIAAVINRQAKYSNAEDYYDNITKADYIKIFSNALGSRGSIQLVGGLANTVLQFTGFITGVGSSTGTQWTITKVGQTVTMQWTGGMNPYINLLLAGDVMMSLLTDNVGYFPITEVDLSNNSVTFENLFAVPGVYTQSVPYQVSFFTPIKNVVFTQINRAIVWEVTPGEVTVEMPATPPVVRRSLIGSAHINGSYSTMTAYNSATSLTVANASTFPLSGNFWLQEVQQIDTRYFTPTEDVLASTTFNTRLQGTPIKYSYTSRLVLETTGNTIENENIITNLGSTTGLAIGQNVFMPGVPSYALITEINGDTVTIDFPASANGTNVLVQFAGNTLNGITPNLPTLASLDENTLLSLTRSGNIVTVTTTNPHDYQVGDNVGIYGSTGITSVVATATLANEQNILTGLSSVVGIAYGQLVVGFGITPGTTVVNVSGDTVIMSLPATASVTESVSFNENLNGGFIIASVPSDTTFTYELTGANGSASTPGYSLVQEIGFAATGSEVIITNALPASFTGITGPYVWDLSAPFVLSSNLATLINAIKAGQTMALLGLSVNTIPASGGYIVFDYGLNTQEGPVKYLYAPNNTTLVLDPSYIFQYDHSAGSTVTALDNLGPHIMSGQGTEYPPYITNPSEVRVTLEELIQSVTSAGIFIDFLIRYPDQLYSVWPTYTVT